MRAPHATRRRITQTAALAATLTFVAGFVDLVGYVALYHVFTANMTGNTIDLPIAGLVVIVAVEFRWPRLPRGEGAVDSATIETKVRE